MRKSLWFMLITALLLAACSSNIATPQATVAPEATQPTTSAQPTATEIVAALPELTTAGPSPDCTTIEAYPTPSVEDDSLFSPISAGDLVFGPDDAMVTLIEYGDYQ